MIKKILITSTFCLVLLIITLILIINNLSNTPYGRFDPVLAVSFKMVELFQNWEKETEEETLKAFYNPESMDKMRWGAVKGAGYVTKKVPFSGIIVDNKIPGEAGDIPIRIYTPQGKGPFPVLIYFHGGGFILGNIEYQDSITRSISEKASVIVISVEYRLAPEHPFPAGLNDAYEAVKWASRNSKTINADPERLAVAGPSAGGNLAAAVSLMSRDKSPGLIDFQVLIYPVINLAEFNTASYNNFAKGYNLTRQKMKYSRALYITNKADLTNPYVSPIYAENFSNLPPALIIGAGFDPLRDEGKAYSNKLKEAGIDVTYIIYDTMAHGFISYSKLLSEAEDVVDDIARALNKQFN
jgi:acetyl esterase